MLDWRVGRLAHLGLDLPAHTARQAGRMQMGSCNAGLLSVLFLPVCFPRPTCAKGLSGDVSLDNMTAPSSLFL